MNEYLLALISFLAAFIFSLGGVGAATILIPIMHSFGIPLSIAKPVGLFYNTISLSGASINNIKNKRLDYKLGLPIIIFSFLFAILGAYLSTYIPTKVILLLFIAFLLFSGLIFLFFKNKKSEIFREDKPWFLLSLIGAFAGLLSGMLGIGGGSIISTFLMMMNYNSKKIAAITAFVVPFSSLSGFLTYLSLGTIDFKLLLITSLPGIVGAIIGTKFMHNRLNPQVVKKILAVILLLMALKMGLNLI